MSSAGRTRSNGQVALTWLGRLFLLAVPFIIICAFFNPKPIQFLDTIACDKGLSLQVQENDPQQPFDNRVACESETVLTDATGRIFGIAGASFLLASGCYALRSRITPRSLSAPRVPLAG